MAGAVVAAKRAAGAGQEAAGSAQALQEAAAVGGGGWDHGQARRHCRSLQAKRRIDLRQRVGQGLHALRQRCALAAAHRATIPVP